MEFKKITEEEFKKTSNRNGEISNFKEEFKEDVNKTFSENKGAGWIEMNLESAFENYIGTDKKSTHGHIVGAFFISLLEKLGYEDASVGTVSVRNKSNKIRVRL